MRDVTAPTAGLSVPSRSSSVTVTVEWNADDGSGAGVAAYDVRVSVDSGPWTGWLTATTQTQDDFIGQFGHRYTFRARAADNVGNVGPWSESAATSVVQVTKYYHFGGQRACPECNRRVAMRQGDVVYYLHGDHLGSTSLATTAAGALYSRQGYYPYGETRYASAAAAGALPTDFGFTGQREEAGFGLYDYHARFYDPALGRFISADTIVPNPANPQDLNRYAYVRNNPLMYIDPSGHVVDSPEVVPEQGICHELGCLDPVWWPAKWHPSPKEKRETLLFMAEFTLLIVFGGPALEDLAGISISAVEAIGYKALEWALRHPKLAKLLGLGELLAGQELADSSMHVPRDPAVIEQWLADNGVTVAKSAEIDAYLERMGRVGEYWVSKGKPGFIVLHTEATYGDLMHETYHFIQDAMAGFPGSYSAATRKMMEIEAYNIELQFAEIWGYTESQIQNILDRLAELGQ